MIGFESVNEGTCLRVPSLYLLSFGTFLSKIPGKLVRSCVKKIHIQFIDNYFSMVILQLEFCNCNKITTFGQALRADSTMVCLGLQAPYQ